MVFIFYVSEKLATYRRFTHKTNEYFYLEADDTPLELTTELPVSDLEVPMSP